MPDKLKLDLVSDVVCPWCIIGYRRLEQAINELGVQDRLDIEWQPFELNPDMPTEGEELREHIIRKYGSTPEHTRETEENIAALGAELNFKFDFFNGMRIVNTRNAHILLDYAKDQHKQTELQLRLFNAYFSEGKNISDRSVLAQEIQSVGLQCKEALQQLDNPNVQENLKTTETYWKNLGITSVPTMVFNRTSALTGAQPVEVYKQTLTNLLNQHP